MGGIARGRGVITGRCAQRANHDEAGFGSTAARPKAALSGAGGAGAAGGRAEVLRPTRKAAAPKAAAPLRASRRAWPATERR
jgi:hypothetical protein